MFWTFLRPRAGRRGVILAFLSGLIVAAGLAFWVYSRAGSGPDAGSRVELGSLPDGVSRSALSLVVITLDTTRADRIGAGGAISARCAPGATR